MPFSYLVLILATEFVNQLKGWAYALKRSRNREDKKEVCVFSLVNLTSLISYILILQILEKVAGL